MSATATLQEGSSSGNLLESPPAWLRGLFASIGLGTLALITLQLVRADTRFLSHVPMLLGWVAVVAVADLIPVPLWDSVTFSMSLPVTLAAGIVFSPAEAALVAFLGALDRREFRGLVSVDHALYNRAQVGLSVLGASWAFHLFGKDLTMWPMVVGAFEAALAVDLVLNAVLVAVPLGVLRSISPWRVLRNVHGERPWRHLAAYACLGSLALVLAAVFEVAGGWGILIFAVPLVLAHQMFSHVRRLEEAARRLEEKNEVVLATMRRLADERRDERLVVAGELHDEVLPPLFKVHLMGQVLRQDLNSGRLLDLDEDLPALVAATDAAQVAIRSLVHDLRKSPLGTDGLRATLKLLAHQAQLDTDARISLALEDDGGSDLVQLLLYQVAREALGNAVRHAAAASITIRLWREDGLLRLLVEDDGVGFSPRLIDRKSHFGLQLMSERIESARGMMFIDSEPGRGTRVLVAIPPEVTQGQ